jgi:hypothetical protein
MCCPPLCRLPLLQAHCALWPHTIQATVYAPVSPSRRFACVDEVASPAQLRAGSSWLAALGLGLGRCQHAGWSLERLRARVREMQKISQEMGALAAAAVLTRRRRPSLATMRWLQTAAPSTTLLSSLPLCLPRPSVLLYPASQPATPACPSCRRVQPPGGALD